MKLILPLNLANKLIDNLKYDQVDIIVPAVFTENYFVNINLVSLIKFFKIYLFGQKICITFAVSKILEMDIGNN